MSITANTLTEIHCGNSQPKDPWKFGMDIQCSQPTNLLGRHTILFNKGRYFETSIYNKETLEQVSELTGLKPQYTNMIVGSWKNLEDFVIAMNIIGIYVSINIDWI